MVNWSVTNVKRIEVTSFDGCEPCDWAISDLRPVVAKHRIPLIINKSEESLEFNIIYPLTCVILEENGKESSQCIQGWDETYAKDILDIIK